jgi:hypothetical protein
VEAKLMKVHELVDLVERVGDRLEVPRWPSAARGVPS